MITSDRVKSWPKKERPRERLLAEGAEKVSDADLLAVILRVGRGSSKAIAKHFAVTWAMLDRWDVTYFRSPLFNPQSNCYPNVLLSDVVQPLSETAQRVNPSESPSETFNYLGMSIPLPPLSVQKQIMVRVAAGREEIAREKASEYGGKKGKHIMIPRLRLPAGGR